MFLTVLLLVVHGVNTKSLAMEGVQNIPPVVKIIKPTDGLQVKWNMLVPYEIEVADQEDGTSEYDEINASEVILQVKYTTDTARVIEHIDRQSQQMPTGLKWISRSNCFSCHRPYSTLIGPSFADVANKYADEAGATVYLLDKIIGGSKGLWGDVEMPPNPELEEEKVKDMVQWILDECDEDDVQYYVGLSGAFRTRESQPAGSEGYYVLSAFYQDYGTEEELYDEVMGEAVVILRVVE